MKKIETGTQLIHLISVSTYGGICDSDRVFDSYTLDQDFKDGYTAYNAEMFWSEGYDNSLYKDKIVKLAIEYLGLMFNEIKKLNLGIKKLNVIKMYSPKEYNFETDHIYFDLVVNNNFHKNLLKIINNLSEENKVKLDEWLRENYSSRSGFSSFTANNLGDLISEIRSEETRETSVFLYWYFLNFGNDELIELMEDKNWDDYFYENIGSASEFVSTEFIESCEGNDKLAVKYTQENYHTKDKETIIAELSEQIINNEPNDWNDTNEVKIEWMVKTVHNVFKSIDDKTLDLFAK